MSEEARRRNGSAPSCEPCRRAKTRCDHTKPICNRCRRRGPDVKCWYHPAPLTRRPNAGSGGRSPAVSALSGADIASPAASVKDKAWQPRTLESLVRNDRLHDEHLAVVAELLDQLSNWPVIEMAASRYALQSQVPMTPTPLTVQVLSAIRTSDIVADYMITSPLTEEHREDRLHHAENVLRSSSREVKILPTTTVAEFVALHTGKNLRIDYLGLVYTLAARGMLYAARRDKYKYEELAQILFRCSDLALRLSRDLSEEVNDVLLWLGHENLMTLTLIEGDASMGVWRRVNNIASDVLALGIHRESKHSSSTTPNFLIEIRRKFFSTSFQYDKSWSALFDRPPRLSRLYSDCTLPLNLTDEQVLAETPEAIAAARSCLDTDGWNKDRIYTSTTWSRVRSLIATIREEMLMFALGATVSPTETELWDLCDRNRQVWDGLPSYLKYRRDMWDTDMPVPIVFMLGNVCLSYLHIEFHARRLLAKINPQELPALLQVANLMVETVRAQSIMRDRDLDLGADLPAQMCFYGLPSAKILVSGLQTVMGDQSLSLPPGLTRSTLIRNISVFIEDLETICGPGSMNHEFCVSASKTMSKALDDILNGNSTSMPSMTGPYATPSASEHTGTTPSYVMPAGAGAMSIDDFGAIDLNNFDIGTFDLADWNSSMNVDWTNTTGDWNIS